MNKKIFQKYAQIKNQIKELQLQAKEIEKSVLEEMKKAGAEIVKSDWGTFSIAKRRIWTYSPKVIDLSEKLRLLKKEEEEKGIASYKINENIVLRPASKK